MECGSIAALATAFLTIVSVVLGVKYRQGISKAKQFSQLLNDIIKAAEDDEVSEEEFRQIVAAAKQIATDMEE